MRKAKTEAVGGNRVAARATWEEAPEEVEEGMGRSRRRHRPAGGGRVGLERFCPADAGPAAHSAAAGGGAPQHLYARAVIPRSHEGIGTSAIEGHSLGEQRAGRLEANGGASARGGGQREVACIGRDYR